jgi:hypothetical protein
MGKLIVPYVLNFSCYTADKKGNVPDMAANNDRIQLALNFCTKKIYFLSLLNIRGLHICRIYNISLYAMLLSDHFSEPFEGFYIVANA